ncbi:MAG: cytochrome c maturation protein CcmE [Pseudomonadales bacterium]|nr:cytochrome c maturation protein CcmE [Pseudomonadales bacterium]
MHPIRKKRLVIVLVIAFGAATAIGLTLYALSENINLFFTPTQIANGEAPVGQRIRIGGMVLEGSVKRIDTGLIVEFYVTDTVKSVPVQYEGILPDLFREGQGIVANGTLNEQGIVIADEVLAKHDENYMPPEAMEAMRQAGQIKKSGGYLKSDE